MKPKKLTKDQIQNTLGGAIKDAIAFVESEIAPIRIKAQKYLDGKSTLPYEEGRSKVVATKCRDTIRAVKPALMRVFLQSDKPVEFAPSRPDVVDGAEQKTRYAQYIFERNGGFMLLHDAFHDALVKKTGIVKTWHDEVPDVEIDEYTGLDEDAVALIEGDQEIEVLEKSLGKSGWDMRVSRESSHGQIRIEGVAPEDFFVDRSAKSIDDCYICGFSTESRVGDVVAMGFDFAEVFDLSGDGDSAVAQEEQLERDGWDSGGEEDGKNDPSMRKIVLTEAYMRMDIEGTGIPRMYKFICGGAKHHILSRELCDENPFAVFEVDPEPHTFFGNSLVEIITDDQDASTSLLRGMLDNLAMMNNPGVEAVENQVNMDDLMNNEIGRIIRVKAPGQLREITIGSAATMALPAIQFYDEAIRAKTGVSGAGMGLDADALQSQTAAGVNAAVLAANQVAELIARVLAEGGMKQLFRKIANLASQHPNRDEMMRVDGHFVPVDPRSWGTEMDMVVNVGIGTGQHMERAMMLDQTIQIQSGIWQAYGPMNGLVTMTHMRNAYADRLRLAGLHNADRYYAPMNPQIEAQVQQAAAQAAAQQGQGSDPNAAYLEAEKMKAQVRMQADQQKAQLDSAKAQADFQFRAQENAQQNDLERDKMAQDLAIRVAELLAKTGVQMNTASLKAEQAAARPTDV